MKKIAYKTGEIIGDYKISFIKDVSSHITKSNRKIRKALFKCNCGNQFTTIIELVKTNNTKSCGCMLSYSKSIKYDLGTTIGKNDIIFIEEIKPKIFLSGKKKRMGKFKCFCGKIFTSIIANIKSNAVKSCGCLNKGWDKNEWIKRAVNPILYLVRLYNKEEDFLKIGITFNSITKRFSGQIPYFYEELFVIKGGANFIWDEEIRLHQLFNKYRYIPSLEFDGDTECFNKQLLKDKDYDYFKQYENDDEEELD